MIIFTKHANEKFEILQRHKFVVSKEQVLLVVTNPDIIDSRPPNLIAQRKFDSTHVLRVVYKKESDFSPDRSRGLRLFSRYRSITIISLYPHSGEWGSTLENSVIKIITFYPGRSKKYGQA